MVKVDIEKTASAIKGLGLDVIGLNLEFNSVDAEGKKNTMLSIHGGAEQRAYRTNPCRVTYFKMEG